MPPAHADALTPTHPATGAAYGALTLAVLLWGGSFVAMRVAVLALGPWGVMWLRMVAATLLVLPFLRYRPRPQMRRGDLPWLLALVGCQPCLYFLLESYALTLTTASQAGLISAAVPLLVAVGARLFLAEPLQRRAVVGLLLALAGVALLTGLNSGDSRAANPVLGNGLEMLAMLCAAGNMLLVRRFSDRYDPWLLTGLQMATGVLFFLPGLPQLLAAGSAVWTPQLIAAMVFLGGCVTLGAFGCYNWGISRLPAARAASFINLVPVTAVTLGWLLLGEALNPAQCLAAAGVLAGVWLSQR